MIKKPFIIVVLALAAATCVNGQARTDNQSVLASLASKGTFVVSKPINPKRFGDHWLIADDTVSYTDNRYGYALLKKQVLMLKA